MARIGNRSNAHWIRKNAQDLFDDTPKLRESLTGISIYDITDKKLVLVFANKTSAGVYIKDSDKSRASASIASYIKDGCKCNKNYFNRPLAIRIAKKEHLDMLKDNIYLCLDDRFERDDLKCKMVSEFNKGIRSGK